MLKFCCAGFGGGGWGPMVGFTQTRTRRERERERRTQTDTITNIHTHIVCVRVCVLCMYIYTQGYYKMARKWHPDKNPDNPGVCVCARARASPPRVPDRQRQEHLKRAYVSIRQHTAAYVSLRQPTYPTGSDMRICQHTAAYVSLRQHTYPTGSDMRI